MRKPNTKGRTVRSTSNDTFSLGRIRGMTLGFHWSLLVFGIFAATNIAGGFLPQLVPGYGPTAYILAATAAVVGLFISIGLHELGHAFAAQRAGVEVDGITLWLLGGVARLKSEASSAGDAFRIAAAGPAVSLALAAGGALSAFVLSAAGTSSLLVALAGYLGVVNLGLAVFNLIPALPLDGGRILQSYLWHRDGDRLNATISAAKIGNGLGWLGVGLGIAQLLSGVGTGLWTILIGWFVLSGASRERRAAEREKRRKQKPTWTSFFDQFGGGPGGGMPQRHPWLGEPIPVKSWEEKS